MHCSPFAPHALHPFPPPVLYTPHALHPISPHASHPHASHCGSHRPHPPPCTALLLSHYIAPQASHPRPPPTHDTPLFPSITLCPLPLPPHAFPPVSPPVHRSPLSPSIAPHFPPPFPARGNALSRFAPPTFARPRDVTTRGGTSRCVGVACAPCGRGLIPVWAWRGGAVTSLQRGEVSAAPLPDRCPSEPLPPPPSYSSPTAPRRLPGLGGGRTARPGPEGRLRRLR